MQTACEMGRLIHTVPVLSLPMLVQYAKMLHYTLTNRRITSYEIHMQYGENVDESDGLMQGKTPQTSPEWSRSVEKRILQDIREGSTKFLSDNEKVTQGAYGLLTSTGNSLRDSQNTILVFNSLCARAAIEGGLPQFSSEAMEHRYANAIENCTTVTELMQLNDTLIKEYADRVSELQEHPYLSPQIRKAMELIRQNVTNPDLSVQYVASRVGYSLYYFTKKFSNETGIKVRDYINRQKVAYAEILLLTTGKSTQEIADELHFGNRTYFSRVFHEVTGVTPAQYRTDAAGAGTGHQGSS